jgi:alkanesulfonate monooxygenase SsuD/methylene tetrahydromethanopterin reductase-like flavin-dependent oxidoreductase (luciferase family)
MKYAVEVPNFGRWADPHAVVALARDAEDAGWDGFAIWDHLLAWDGNEVADPWVALAAVAAATERVTVMTMVTPLPRRTPWKLARECVTLDHLSGGRFVLGVGLGWPTDPEYTRFGGPTGLRTRADMLDEGLAVLRGLWSGERFVHEGAHYRVGPVQFLPTPVRPDGIPIWVAGMWPHRRPFRRAARYDGVAPIVVDDTGEFVPMTPETLTAIVAYVTQHRPNEASYEVAPGGCALAGPDRGAAVTAEMASAGATWWRENWVPGTIDFDEWLARLRDGPPAA